MTSAELIKFRAMKDEFFRNNAQSPLTPQQRSTFEGLRYFDENSELRLEIAIQKFPAQNEFTMQTSTGDEQTYRRYGEFLFDVNGTQARLTLYASDHGYFLPFVDSQAGNETYGAGRYLDPVLLSSGKFLIDFNLAYNPYCAYNENWSCPIPPSENRIEVPIRAGERNFKAT
ncbi:MAG: DUF1684 domain-containing protein [Anaerolineae bacterium]|nr:DUF1684 domain-containing protein [Anaerolineae bacterium]